MNRRPHLVVFGEYGGKVPLQIDDKRTQDTKGR